MTAATNVDEPRTEATEVVTAHTNLAGVHLAAGELDKAVKLKGIAVTKGAREAIEKAGGQVEE